MIENIIVSVVMPVYNEEKYIVYDPRRKGFYVSRRMYDLYDIRLMAECIYSAKFLEEGQSKRLADIVCSLVSEEEAKQIADGIKDVYEEAKAAGLNPKYIKQCIKLRAKDPDELAEDDELTQMYRKALGI